MLVWMVMSCQSSPQDTMVLTTPKIEKQINAGKPVLKIGDRVIYEGQIKLMSEVMPGFQEDWASPIRKKEVAQSLIEQELFLQKAREQNLIENNERLQKNLWVQGRNYQAGTYLLQEIDEQAKAQYEADKDRYYKQVELKDIVYMYKNIQAPTDIEKKEKALAKAQATRQRLTAENFSEVASQETDNLIARADEGRIGTVNMLDERIRYLKWGPLVAQAFDMKEGEISQPIVTDEGVHIIQLVQAPTVQAFEDVLPIIRTQLEEKIKHELLAQMLEETNIEYLDPTLKPDQAQKP